MHEKDWPPRSNVSVAITFSFIEVHVPGDDDLKMAIDRAAMDLDAGLKYADGGSAPSINNFFTPKNTSHEYAGNQWEIEFKPPFLLGGESLRRYYNFVADVCDRIKMVKLKAVAWQVHLHGVMEHVQKDTVS